MSGGAESCVLGAEGGVRSSCLISRLYSHSPCFFAETCLSICTALSCVLFGGRKWRSAVAIPWYYICGITSKIFGIKSTSGYCFIFTVFLRASLLFGINFKFTASVSTLYCKLQKTQPTLASAWKAFLNVIEKNLCRIIFLDDLIQEERNYLNASLFVYCYWFHCHRLSSCSYTVSAISWIIPFYLKSSREQLWPMCINAVWMNLGTFSEQILVITGQWCANWPVSKISVQLGASVELTARHP